MMCFDSKRYMERVELSKVESNFDAYCARMDQEDIGFILVKDGIDKYLLRPYHWDSSEMWHGFYSPHRRTRNPLHNDDCIYTPGVVVFKSDTDEPRLRPERMWYTVDILTCAAPNLRERPGATK